MRVNCEVLLRKTKLSSPSFLGRSYQASLSIGWQKGSSAEPSNTFVYLCPAKTKKFSKFKVAGNVEKLFTKLVGEGKFFIYFKEPKKKLYVKADDPLLAKRFIQTLKAVLASRDLDKIQPFNLKNARPRQPTGPKNELTMTMREDDPFTKNFPHRLHKLKVLHTRMQQVPPCILDLPDLHTLDLGMNFLNTLPVDLGKMAALTYLDLNHNRLTDVPPEVFSGNITNTLNTLDLSYNYLKSLPHTLTRLHNLESLSVAGNELTWLPLNMGRLSKLKRLNIDYNSLVALPASLCNLKLHPLRYTQNPFDKPMGIVENRLPNGTTKGPPPLRDLATLACIEEKIMPAESDIPATLHHSVLDYQLCVCGRPCFESFLVACVPLKVQTHASLPWVWCLYNLEQGINSDLEGDLHLYQSVVPAVATLCSHQCLKKATRRSTRAILLTFEEAIGY